jgi:hypothetical protein
MGVETKNAVSVAEMARMVGLSRARFYQLMGSAFPWPVYDVSTHRPLYVEEAQKVCLEVKRRNCGIDGKPILFYARHVPRAAPKKRPSHVQKLNKSLLDGLKSLGISASSAQVEATFQKLFPRGIDGIDHGEVIRSVFIHLKQEERRA